MSGLPERGIYFQERGPAPFCAANRQKIWPDSRAGQAGSLWSSACTQAARWLQRMGSVEPAADASIG